MMAGGIKSRRTLSLLILLIFLSLTELLEVKDEWQELRPDTAGLHRLRGLSEHMLHEGLKNPSDQRVDIGQSVQGHWQQCEEGFTSCDIQEEQITACAALFVFRCLIRTHRPAFALPQYLQAEDI
ncbi:unnamed protein product [Leuciscus chuanchicus]